MNERLICMICWILRICMNVSQIFMHVHDLYECWFYGLFPSLCPTLNKKIFNLSIDCPRFAEPSDLTGPSGVGSHVCSSVRVTFLIMFFSVIGHCVFYYCVWMMQEDTHTEVHSCSHKCTKNIHKSTLPVKYSHSHW